ncbi:3-methyladenine DNA glycosylase [Corynebacterium mayonis]|uniref:3-methyladenine DNA glycosylase n=1 Tax=Corynebacterium mayonis TaxID=3062461 RepID=UPI00314052A8
MGNTLTRQQWTNAQADHETRARQWVDPHLKRKASGQSHPVWDFLFDYYWPRPSHLTRWNPGLGTQLAQAADCPIARRRHYMADKDGAVRLDVESFLAHRGDSMRQMRDLMAQVDTAFPHFDCFGMHEWAMVYRSDNPRHDLPLRLGVRATNKVVDAHPLKCTHYDAFRYFTPAARPLNLTVLDRSGQADNDQPGCVHVTMDLYKWAMNMGPVVPGELLLDIFELAREARRLDMEASPYDCRGLGLGVVAVETPEGKAEYVRRQRELATRAKPLRVRLVELLDRLFGE